MNRLSKDQQKKILAIAIGTLVAIIGLYFGLVSYQQTALAVSRNRVVAAETKLKEAANLIKNAQDWQKAVEVRTEMLNEIEEGMASGDAYSWIIRVVNKFKIDYKIDIPNFSPAQAVTVGILPNFPYQAVLFKVKALGYYHDFGKFLADFENKFPHMRVQNLNMEPGKSGGSDESEVLEVNMEVVALIKPTAAR
jgi:Tfp pilus assembly protein PilO